MASSTTSTGRCLKCKADPVKVKWSHCSKCRFDIAEKLEAGGMDGDAANKQMLVKIQAKHQKSVEQSARLQDVIARGAIARGWATQEEVADQLLSETPETPVETNSELIAKVQLDYIRDDIAKKYPKIANQAHLYFRRWVNQAGSYGALLKKSCDEAEAKLEEDTYGAVATSHGYHHNRAWETGGASGLGKTGRYYGAPEKKKLQCDCRIWAQVQIKGKPGKFSYPNVRCKKTVVPGERMCSACLKKDERWEGERFFGFIQEPPPADPVYILDQPHRFLGSENYDDIQMPPPPTKYATKYFEGRDTLPWLDAYLTKTPMENPFFEKGGCLIDRTPDTSESDSGSDAGSQ